MLFLRRSDRKVWYICVKIWYIFSFSFSRYVNNFQYSAESIVCDGKKDRFFNQAYVKAEPVDKVGLFFGENEFFFIIMDKMTYRKKKNHY